MPDAATDYLEEFSLFLPTWLMSRIWMPQKMATKKPGNQARPLNLKEQAQAIATMAMIARMEV